MVSIEDMTVGTLNLESMKVHTPYHEQLRFHSV